MRAIVAFLVLVQLQITPALAQEAGTSVEPGPMPLLEAARLDDTEMAALTLRLGANPAAREEMTRETPLHKAALWSTPQMIGLLARAGAPLDARDWNGETALFTAARLGRADIVAALIAAGAAVDLPDAAGRTALLAALQYRPQPDYREGLDDAFVSNAALAGADKNALARGRDHAATALLLAPLTEDVDRAFAEAVWGGYGEVARLLAARGALGQAVTQDGRPALAGTFHHQGLAMFELVAAATTRLSIDGNEAMISAAAAGRMDIVRALLDRRYPIDTRDRTGRTAFLAAAVEGRVDAVRQIVALGADIGAREEAGRDVAALMRARLEGLVCHAQAREASRAWRPTDHIRAEAARLETAHREILQLAGLPAPAGGLMPADDWTCERY